MNNSKRAEIVVLPTPAKAAEAAARRFVDLAGEAIERRGRFCVALSGGNTPKAVHKLLAAPPLREQIDWDSVQVFWGDERFVPPEDPESNFRMARETLLDQVAIPAENIHPVPTSGLTPEDAAQRYAATLKTVFAAAPEFDLIFLGLGPDGHTASLFPAHSEILSPGNTLVAVVKDAPKPPPVRITLTLKIINNALNVIFLVTGSDKAATVKSVIAGEKALPAAAVQPRKGKLTWLLDEAAAQYLASK